MYIFLYLYELWFIFQSVVEQVCRLARTIASPQESAHTVLIAEGCPGRCTVIAKLAAHLCGYTVYQVNPCSLNSSREYKMEQFKSDLVQCYTRAGSKVGTCSTIWRRSIGGHTKTQIKSIEEKWMSKVGYSRKMSVPGNVRS